MDTLFRIASGEVEFELEGPEDFVRRQLERFLPPKESVSGPGEEGVAPLAAWFQDHFPRGRLPNMQDSILLFAYFLKRERNRHIFTSGDLKRSFGEVGRSVPKSLLQLVGALKRDRGLLLSPGNRRGRYALSPEGIRRVEEMLGIERDDDARVPAVAGSVPEIGGDGEILSGTEKWHRLFGAGAEEGDG